MTTEGKSNPLALVGLLTLTLIWSYSWIAMKQVTLYIGAFDFTALRCICGALLLFLVLLLRGRGMRPTPFGYTLAIALLQTCGMIGLAQWALMSGGAGKVAILTYTMPFWAVVTLYHWARGESWERVREISGMDEGDLAMVILRTADHLRQIESLAESHPRLAASARKAIERILREPVLME